MGLSIKRQIKGAALSAFPELALQFFSVRSRPDDRGPSPRGIQLNPRYVLNIGCAEGFYAVGLAMRLNDARVFAADADPKALSATMKNAELNGVSARVYTLSGS